LEIKTLQNAPRGDADNKLEALLKAKEEREKQAAQYTFQIHKRVGYKEIEIVRLYCIVFGVHA
jgi:hypothetical protein